MRDSKRKIWERIVPIKRMDRSWDIRFWQSKTATVRFNATWGLIEDVYRIRGRRPHANSFRLQRSAEKIKQA